MPLRNYSLTHPHCRSLLFVISVCTPMSTLSRVDVDHHRCRTVLRGTSADRDCTGSSTARLTDTRLCFCISRSPAAARRSSEFPAIFRSRCSSRPHLHVTSEISEGSRHIPLGWADGGPLVASLDRIAFPLCVLQRDPPCALQHNVSTWLK